MKFTKLLVGASAIALVAGSAHGQVTSYLGDADDDAGVDEIQAGFSFAEEVDFTAGIDSVLGVMVDTAISIAGGTNVQVEINLSGPVSFDGQVADSAMTLGSDSTDSGTGFVVTTSPAYPGGPTLPGTGADGEQSVTFQYEIAGGGEDGLGFQLPVTFTGCGEVTGTITLRTDLGIVIQNGLNIDITDGLVPSGAGNLFDCPTSAVDMTFASDESTQDTVVENDDDFTDLGDGLINGFDDDTTSVLGTATGTLTLLDGDGRALAVDVVTFAPHVISTADFLATTGFTVSFANDANIDAVDYDGVACTDNANNTWDCAFPGADFDATARDISIDVTPAAGETIARQDVSVTGGTSFFDPAAGPHPLIVSESYAGAALDSLNWVGIGCGPFDWVSDRQSAVGRNDIIRITGLPAGDVDFAMTLINANDPATDGDYHGTLADRDGDRRINSNTMFGLAGAFGTGDVFIHLFVDDDNDVAGGTSATGTAHDDPFGTGVDCDRLVADMGGTITSYGDASNNAGTGDAMWADGASSADTVPQN